MPADGVAILDVHGRYYHDLITPYVNKSNKSILESALHVSDMEKSNILLLDNIYSDLLCIHDRELEVNSNDCVQFIDQVMGRHKEKLHSCPLSSLNLDGGCYFLILFCY